MMYGRMTYRKAIESAAHLVALGETTIYLDENDPGLPWHKAEDVEVGAGYRFSGPSGCYIIARECGLTLKWSVDFEGREANGQGVSLFDRARLREVARKLPPPAQCAFAELFATKVMPDLEKRTRELREALNKQMDSEDCVRGLIASVNETSR